MGRRSATRVRQGLLLAIALIALAVSLWLPSRASRGAGSMQDHVGIDTVAAASKVSTCEPDARQASGLAWMPQAVQAGPLPSVA